MRSQDRAAMVEGLTVSLGRLGKGQKAEVVGLDEQGVVSTLQAGELERRLIEMGLVEGAHLEVLHEGFPGRDPIAVRVDDHTVALRRAEAAAVLVRLPKAAV
ncbi:FeoA family protein [Magnetospirillum sp. LM-5]|uniref:FeoA family protein n=1 Tax=Magnetospirillum sp. LM-5 TaxID=2681466 RepID=UPI00156DB22A|nr:FeoA family protein [Magnetospirillum sp. LM-5]